MIQKLTQGDGMMKNDTQTQEHQYTLYVDLDGVLANFAAMATKVMHEAGYPDFNYSQAARFGSDKKMRDTVWNCISEYQKKFGFVVWRELEVMQDAYTLWNYVKPYHAQILTAAGQPQYHAAEQKRAWVTENFGSNIRINTVQTAALKAGYATPTSILIDDQPRAIDPWLANSGIGILHTSAANTIKQLKELGL